MIDAYSKPEPATTCDPTPKKGVLAFSRWVLDSRGGKSAGIVRACSPALVAGLLQQGKNPSLHYEGRAWDWTPPGIEQGDTSVADAFLEELMATDAEGNEHALARRAGIRHVIWRGQIWTAGTREWRPYSGASPHQTHVHFGFSRRGAAGRTSLYQPKGGDGVRVVVPFPRCGSGDGGDLVSRDEMTTAVADARGFRDRTTPRFRSRFVRMAKRLGLDPSALACVVAFETAGTWDPAKRANNNPRGAVGLIQFTPKWAPKVVGATADELAAMSAEGQLRYVERWYERVGLNRIHTPLDHYLAVFAPEFVGQPPNTAVYVAPSDEYKSNASMDVDGDGVITVGDIGARWLPTYEAALARPPVLVRDEQWPHALAGAICLAGLAGIPWWARRG